MTPVSTDQHSVILPSIIYNDNVISCLTCAQKLIFLNALVFLCFFFFFFFLFVCLFIFLEGEVDGEYIGRSFDERGC